MSNTSQARTAFGYGCASLFAIPFAAVGVFMAWTIVQTLVEHQAMRSWVETPAFITRAELESHVGEGVTYRVVADYQYEFDDRDFHGSRVGLSDSSDNVGDFHQRVHGELRGYQISRQPFRCFVNPVRPEQSILYRDVRWEMIAFYDVFVLTFGGIGVGMFLVSIFAWRTARRRATLMVEYPDQPWLWRDDWAANQIQSTDTKPLAIVLTVTLFWNLVALPLWWLLPPQIARGNFSALWPMLLPAIGAILVWASTAMWLPYRKYGRCLFRLTTPQAVIGSELSGVIETSRPVECDQFQVVLLCQNKVLEGEGTTTHEVFRQEQTVPNPQTAGWGDVGTSIPVRFEVPADCRPTGETTDGTVQWTLIAKSEDPAVRFKVEFHVPVFRPSV